MKHPSAVLGTLLALWAGTAAGQKQVYLEEIRRAAEKGWREYPSVIERWREDSAPNVLWGYNAPGYPVYLAATLSFLYEQTGERIYAERAGTLLSEYGALRETLPPEFRALRVEYADGVPTLSNFFFLPPYVRAYLRIRNSGVLSRATRERVEREIAESVDFVFRFPEWGAHNRAMLRAEALQYAALALPGHPHAARWRSMSRIIAEDNIGHWEIEDASGYNPVWLHALFSYAETAGRTDLFRSPVIRYYQEYYCRLFGPNGTIPDFGDAAWNSSASSMRTTAFFEKVAAVDRNPHYKWAARTAYETIRSRTDTLGVGDAYHLSDAYRWSDESVPIEQPDLSSGEVLDEVIGKKIVFRNGMGPEATYLLLNYRDEGDGGWQDRHYLRNTITVEEEKMHHGHADENSIVLLMDGGSVLLHDGGYRDGLPSGRFGAWRADYFHNRVVARKDKRDGTKGVFAFLQNSGAYRPVQTRKIEFRRLPDVDMSRTRLIDDELGWQWDRTVVYLRAQGMFVVVDGIAVLRPDYFTFANLWYGQHVLSSAGHAYDVVTDSVPGYRFGTARSLAVVFPETYAKTDSVEPVRRHWQDEQLVYQAISSQYKAGDTEMFVTLLVPHDRTTALAEAVPEVRVLPTSAPFRAVGIEVRGPTGVTTVGIKLDLSMDIARENIRPRTLYEEGKVRYGHIETDAHFFVTHVDTDSLRWSALNLLRFVYNDTTLMAALPNTHGLQPDGGPDTHVGYSKWRQWDGVHRLWKKR